MREHLLFSRVLEAFLHLEHEDDSADHDQRADEGDQHIELLPRLPNEVRNDHGDQQPAMREVRVSHQSTARWAVHVHAHGARVTDVTLAPRERAGGATSVTSVTRASR